MVNCSKKSRGESLTRFHKVAFLLTDGTSISNDDTDDYNPVLLPLSDGRVALLFGSDRDPPTGKASTSSSNTNAGATNTASKSTKHNIFLTITEQPYFGFGPYPTFSTPVALTNSGSHLDKSARIAFTARLREGNIDVAMTDINSDKKIRLFSISDMTTGAITNPNFMMGPGSTDFRQGKIIGRTFKQGGGLEIIYRNISGNVVLADPDASLPTTDGNISNTSITSDSSVAHIPEMFSFSQNSYFFTNWSESDQGEGGLIYGGEGDQIIGEPFSLNDAITFRGLKVSNISTYYSEELFMSGMAFSAGQSFNANQNLYAINTHDLFGLWELNFSGLGNFTGPAGSFALGGPIIEFAYADTNGAYVDLIFDQPVYGDAALTTAVTAAAFSIQFVSNGGGANNATITSVSDDFGSPLVGGEFIVRLNKNLDGTASGDEQLEVFMNPGTIYGITGIEADPTSTSGIIGLGFGSVGALTPIFTGIFVDPSYTYADIYFDQGVFSTDQVSPLSLGDLNVTFYQNGGTASALTPTSLTDTLGGALIGGETVVRLNFTVTGTPDGNEYFEVAPAGPNYIFGINGLAMEDFELISEFVLSGGAPSGPTFSGVVLDPGGNTYVDLIFDSAVWGDAIQSSPVSGSAFTLNFQQNGGIASNVTITSLTQDDGSTPLAGGETTIRVHLNVTGTPDGNETIEITPLASNVFNASGDPQANTDTTGPIFLNPTPPQILPGSTVPGGSPYIEITFNVPIWDISLSAAPGPADFNLVFSQNAGTATAASIVTVNNNIDSPASGGETVLRLTLNVTGTINGAETIEVMPATSSSLFDTGGAPMNISETTLPVNLSP